MLKKLTIFSLFILILPFFQTVQHETHIPMLYVSHDMDEIKQLTEAVWLL